MKRGPEKIDTYSRLRGDTRLPKKEVDPDETPFDEALVERLETITLGGLTPGTALDLLAGLMIHVPSASKETVDRIKTVDKLMNTARAMMETKIRNDEVIRLTERLEELEGRLAEFASSEADTNLAAPVEIWGARRIEDDETDGAAGG